MFKNVNTSGILELRLPRAQRMQKSFYMVLFKQTCKYFEKEYFDPWIASETLVYMKWDNMKSAFACDLICTGLGELTCTSLRGRSALEPQNIASFRVSV